MTRFWTLTIALLLSVSAWATTDHVPGEVLVQFKTTPTGRALVSAPIVGVVRAEATGLGVLQVSTPVGVNEHDLVRYYRQRPDVRFAELNYRKRRFVTPNDPRYNEQWSLPKVQAPAAWGITEGNQNVIVAIIDDGVDGAHPDLSSKLVPGRDISDNDSNTNPLAGDDHGTHCAGIAGAATNNAVGIAGMGFRVRIMPLKIWPNATDFTSAQAIRYAADNGAKVISMSYGSNFFSQSEFAAVQYAWGKGCVLVGAAGNDGVTTRYYPAAFANVIAVGSTTTSDTRSSFSNFNSLNDAWVDVAAPGSSILSTVPGGYGVKSGTSMATPLVAGLAGLLASVAPPGTSNTELRLAIETSCDPVVGSFVTFGRVNALKALQSLSPTVSLPSQATISFGSLVSGNVGSLLSLDGNRLAIQSAPSSLGQLAQADLIVPMQGAVTGLSDVRFETAALGPRGGTLQVFFRNPSTNQFVLMRSTALAPGNPPLVKLIVDRNMAAYVNQGTLTVRLRAILPNRFGPAPAYTVEIDRAAVLTR